MGLIALPGTEAAQRIGSRSAIMSSGPCCENS